MNFYFDLSASNTSRSYKLASFFLFQYSKWLSWLFFFLFLISLGVFIFSFFGFLNFSDILPFSFIFLFLTILFWEISLFTSLKLKKPSLTINLTQTIENKLKSNLADFLSFQTHQIIEKTIKRAQKQKFLEVSSEMLLNELLKKNEETQKIIYRLGIDCVKVGNELKNYLAQGQRQNKIKTSLADSFQNVILEAAVLAAQRENNFITPKELLVALAKHDSFFKKVLLEYELKDEDLENITFCLDKLEKKIDRKKQFWTRENLAQNGSLGRDFSSGFTITLDSYSVDWRKEAKRNVFKEIIGHESEIEQLEIILAEAGSQNPLIVGQPGVGRKSIAEALAQRCYLRTGLTALYDKRVVELDMVSLISQTKDSEQLELLLNKIFQETLTAGNIILVIDELDNFVNQEENELSSIDLSVILSKYLSRPDFQFIGITSYEGLRSMTEKKSAFLENFSKIEVSEISLKQTMLILQNLAFILEPKNSLLITYPAIREIINLADRYMPNLYFPKKAIDLLYELVAYVQNLKDAPILKGKKIVLPIHVAKIISDKTKIPIGKVSFQEKSVLLNLENLLHQRVIGQNQAIDEIAIAMRRARAGIGSKKRPMGVFLFLGPTGVGKTETAKALAEIYFSGEKNIIRLDMSEFQQISDIGRLIGQVAPTKEHGLLTTPVLENPFSLVLIDEIEKSHPNILNLFLQVFDEGHITDGWGRKIIFANTIIICTSNAGADVIFKQTKINDKLDKDEVLAVIFERKIFKQEFINRFDAVVLFNSLTKENLADIAQLMLGNLQKNLKEKNIDFIITPQLKEKIVELSYKPEFGAREMRRVVQNKVESIVAQALLSDKILPGNTIEINPENFNIVIIK